MENFLKKLLASSLVFIFLATAFIPNVKALVTYTMNGLYLEDGSDDLAGINVTMTRIGESPEKFFLNGTYLANATTGAVVFSFDLGYNESRTYYTINSTAEAIYVFRPSDPFYTYFIEVIDYVGLDWGYLESVINVGGNERVVERWSLEVLNEIPFMFTWGKAYTLRLICNRGTYVYGTYVAGASTSFTLAVTSDMFPEVPTDTSGLSITAARMNTTWIYAYYRDINLATNWTYFEIIEYGETTPVYTFNSTSQTISLNWYDAASDTDYYVVVTIMHSVLGVKYWSFACPAPVSGSNPFTILSDLGDFPFDPMYIIPVAVLVAIGLCFTWFSIPVGMVVLVIVAAIETWMGWLVISWTWLSLAGTIIIMLAIGEAKERVAA